MAVDTASKIKYTERDTTSRSIQKKQRTTSRRNHVEHFFDTH
jgi:hypothetical protein